MMFLPSSVCADELLEKAAIPLPLVGLTRSMQDPITGGHGAQKLYCFISRLLKDANLTSPGNRGHAMKRVPEGPVDPMQTRL